MRMLAVMSKLDNSYNISTNEIVKMLNNSYDVNSNEQFSC